ncbi:hypothetical protein LLG95_10655 [bacterium]|nr:hypothetical protein [bacterium]
MAEVAQWPKRRGVYKLDPGVRGVGGREVAKSELKNLSDHHVRIMQLQLAGKRPAEIAEEVGLKVGTVRVVQRQEIYLRRLGELRRELEVAHKPLKERFGEIAPKALSVVEEIMEDKAVTPSTRLAAAQDALDRAGYGAPKKVEGLMGVALFTPEDLAALRERRRIVDVQAGTPEGAVVG